MYNPPVIGIILDYEQPGGYSKFPWYALRANYSSAVEQAGGLPILLPYANQYIKHYAQTLDGLLIAGGDFDIPPAFYGDTPHHTVKERPQRSIFERDLAEAMFQANKPMLGICGGHQLLNILTGGTLIQHIPDEISSAVVHEQPHPKYTPTHRIIIDQNSLLYRITRSSEFKVNSTHHQAIKMPGKGFKVSATADDGIIEAIEYPDARFCVGVQWHPEFLGTKEDELLFKAFVEAAA